MFPKTTANSGSWRHWRSMANNWRTAREASKGKRLNTFEVERSPSRFIDKDSLYSTLQMIMVLNRKNNSRIFPHFNSAGYKPPAAIKTYF
jgi:hypothetical protein